MELLPDTFIMGNADEITRKFVLQSSNGAQRSMNQVIRQVIDLKNMPRNTEIVFLTWRRILTVILPTMRAVKYLGLKLHLNLSYGEGSKLSMHLVW